MIYEKPNCYIEFRVYDEKRFQILQRFFEPLKDYTQNDNSDAHSDTTTANRTPVSHADETQEHIAFSSTEATRARRHFAKPEEWLLALRPQDLELLKMPEHPNAIVAFRSWQGLSRREKRKLIKADPNKEQLQMLSDFGNMLRYWQDVEFELVALKRDESDRASIVYSTFDFPFEGKVALEELLMFFGFLSIINDSC
jgi:hypothetical protein